MYERPIVGFTFSGFENGKILFQNDQFIYELVSISPGILRLRLFSSSHPLPPHSNTCINKNPRVDEIERVLLEDNNEFQFIVDSFHIRVSLQEEGTISLALQDCNQIQLYKDIPYKGYCTDREGITNYVEINKNALHLGLGEKSAPFDLTYRSFKFFGCDAVGYNPFGTDPLYKQNPLLITLPIGGGWCLGEFSTSNSKGEWNLGSEIDHYWGDYRVLKQEHGGLEKYFIVGSGLEDVVRKYAKIVSFPMLPSRHWLGYLASSMKYADSVEPTAQSILEEFPETCAAYGIPCSAMHISSGYTISEKPPIRRDVFTLNSKTFPDFCAMCEKFHHYGMQVAANVKPYISNTHKDYEALKASRALFKDPDTNGPAVTKVWTTVLQDDSAIGSWVDLTSRTGLDWWQKGIEQLLKMGVDVPWNDNNEYSLNRDDYICQFEMVPGTPVGPLTVGLSGRMIHTQMMAKGSYDAIRRVHPNRRPFVLTRSSNVGSLRYATSSWSGDNFSSWRTLKGNTIMSLNAGLTLLHSYGHDVGGFFGPAPSPDLFLRWVQVAIYSTRFTIHSAGEVDLTTEPWMYPDILPQIRETIMRRYELIPYIYNLLWESHTLAIPPCRWSGWSQYERDINCYNPDVLESADFWFGDSLFICGVFEEGLSERKIYLPAAEGEFDQELYYLLSEPYSIHKSGQWTTVKTPLDSIAIFAKVGTAIPIGKPSVTVTLPDRLIPDQDLVTLDDWRGIEIFPPLPKDAKSENVYKYNWKEDEGEEYHANPSEFSIEYIATNTSVKVQFYVIKKNFKPCWKTLFVILPVYDNRNVTGAKFVSISRKRRVWKIDINWDKFNRM